ncbi:spiro-SPASM protein [Spirochaetia bacterium]|nr:spiro-SPASM protein [Spirochaetia bacterium]
MNALAVLYGGSLTKFAFERVFASEPKVRGGQEVRDESLVRNGPLVRDALTLALERAAGLSGTTKTVLFIGDGFDRLAAAANWEAPNNVELVRAPVWTKKRLLETISTLSQGFDLTWFAWADCPLLDGDLAAAVADRHLRFAAEYSYADGWPYGFAPELLAPGVAGILAKITGDDDGPVERDALFSVIQKDINAFDIETEISPVDLRNHRLSLTADTKRNLMLLTSLIGAGLKSASDAAGIIEARPELLRTLPAFYAIQTSGPCAKACKLCPYPQFGALDGTAVTARQDFLDPAKFEALLDQIAAFSDDAVIDLSLWGEFALHPQKIDLIRMTLERPDLSLIIETSGLGWKLAELEEAAALAAQAALAASRCSSFNGAGRTAPKAPLSWIVSLDTADEKRYGEIRGPGFAEAMETTRTLIRLFPGDTYVQAVRVAGEEDDTEKFYRTWKDELAKTKGAANIIIQKYDDFCGVLPKKQATDLSPVTRRPCWHLMRDMNIVIDGRVLLCREELSALGNAAAGRVLGNVFEESLETIWLRGTGPYREQCSRSYAGICAGCDEYYTFNF